MLQLNAITAIAFRDLVKLLRDPARIAASLIGPLIFIGLMGGTLDANLGDNVGYSFMTFVFTGVYAQTLFQSAALGMVFLIEDRENDFSQEIFVSPVSRYSIIIGKILGEAMVAMVQGVSILVFGLVLGVEISLMQLLGLLVVGIIVTLFGGAFGVLMLANLNSQRAAQQIFPFIMLPQYFLAGIFSPITVLPWYLEIFSRISPMRYAVDITRAFFYDGLADYDAVVLDPAWINSLMIVVLFAAFVVVGTAMFVRAERNR